MSLNENINETNNIDWRICKCSAANFVEIDVERFCCSNRYDLNSEIICDDLQWTRSEEAETDTWNVIFDWYAVWVLFMTVFSRHKNYESECWRQSFENKYVEDFDEDDERRNVTRTEVSVREDERSELIICVSVVCENVKEFVKFNLFKLNNKDVISHRIIVIVVIAT